MQPIRLPQPGDPYVSAEVFLALYRELVRTGKIEGSGLAVDSGAGGVHISAPQRPPAFWAEITGEPEPGRYSWEEVERTGIDTFTTLEFGRTDDNLKQPAIEVNKAQGIASGTYVFLELGFGRPVTAGVEQEWIFRHGGGGGGETGFWCRVDQAFCREGRYRIVELEKRPYGGWVDKEDGIVSDQAFHCDKGNYYEGPLLKAGPISSSAEGGGGTVCWARPGYFSNEYILETPAGYTGRTQQTVDVICQDGSIAQLKWYFHWRNGQLTREPCVGNINVCGPCSGTHPFTPFGSFLFRAGATVLAALGAGAGALL